MGAILVTGVSGFIGRATAKALKAEGHKVIGFDRHPKPVEGCEIIKKGDMIAGGDSMRLRDLIAESDGIINLAGVLGTSELLGAGTWEAVRLNIEAAVQIFNACREFNKPAVQITVGNKDWPSIYSITKVAAEKIALAYNRDLGTRIAVVRAMNAYGPYQKAAPVRKLIPNLIRWAMLNEPARIYGDGEQELDPIYVDDVGGILADALRYAASSQSGPSRVFEAGTGVPITVNEMADLVWQHVRGWNVAPKVYEPMRAGEPINSTTVADDTTLRWLGWGRQHDGGGVVGPDMFQPATRKVFRPLSQGLRETVQWYKAHPEILGLEPQPAESSAG